MSNRQKTILIAFCILMAIVYIFLAYKAIHFYKHRNDPIPFEQKPTYLGTHTVTFYCANVCQPDRPCLTATSTEPKPSRTVAVDPRFIPLGSKIHVEEFGYLIAEDTGGDIKGNRLDIFTATCAEARQYGSKLLEVHLVHDISH